MDSAEVSPEVRYPSTVPGSQRAVRGRSEVSGNSGDSTLHYLYTKLFEIESTEEILLANIEKLFRARRPCAGRYLNPNDAWTYKHARCKQASPSPGAPRKSVAEMETEIQRLKQKANAAEKEILVLHHEKALQAVEIEKLRRFIKSKNSISPPPLAAPLINPLSNKDTLDFSALSTPELVREAESVLRAHATSFEIDST